MSGGYSFLGEGCNAVTYGNVNASTTGTVLSSANTWVQLTAATTSDAELIYVHISYDSGSANYCATIDIAIGAGGSEVVILSGLVAYPGITPWIFPITIPSGTRIAARCTQSQGTTTSVSVTLIDGTFDLPGGLGVDTIGFAANPNGTLVTPNATAHTKGSYAQLTASTSNDYVGFNLRADWGGTTQGTKLGHNHLFDIAIGGAGSEVIIIPDYLYLAYFGSSPRYYPIAIPAGTRVAARCQADIASQQDMSVTLYGVYK